MVDDTYLHDKYEGVLLSAVAQDTENHVYPIYFCVMDKENDSCWTFFFEKLKEIVVDEPDLCFIFDRYKRIANGIAKVYNHAHRRYCLRHFGENFLDEFPVTTIVLKQEVDFEKWRRIAKRFGELFMERHAYVLKSKDNKMVLAAETTARKK
ncbi:hypothetical protein KY289_011556 [Solanum tuberosum]|nr:hypothetical protein KY289_011556 [Solanum tuberosum]KAH0709634.1 hypothetical protein KY284_011061 [Solanum tuberosum]